MSKKSKEEILNNLPNFTGTEQWHKFSMFTKLLATDGAIYVAKSCGAFWLLDIIVSCQQIAKVRNEEFQVFKLTVNDGQGVVTVEDGNDNEVYRQEIPYTDFPLDEITLWVTGGVVLLPSEY
jgi:hypothetical protein